MPQKTRPASDLGEEWLRANTAAKRFNIPASRLARLALSGAIRTRAVPGSTPRFHAADVAKAAAIPA
jgi:hypothetical protein